MKRSLAEKKSGSENHKEKNTSDGGKEKNPPRRVVHSLKSSAQKEEGGGKVNKGSKGTDSREKVTVKISPATILNSPDPGCDSKSYKA